MVTKWIIVEMKHRVEKEKPRMYVHSWSRPGPPRKKGERVIEGEDEKCTSTLCYLVSSLSLTSK